MSRIHAWSKRPLFADLGPGVQNHDTIAAENRFSLRYRLRLPGIPPRVEITKRATAAARPAERPRPFTARFQAVWEKKLQMAPEHFRHFRRSLLGFGGAMLRARAGASQVHASAERFCQTLPVQ